MDLPLLTIKSLSPGMKQLLRDENDPECGGY